MSRPPFENRRNVADATLTLRLTHHDRELLRELVAMKAEELVDSGMETTAASYVRGLIRQEARAKGLVSRSDEKKKSGAASHDEDERPRANGRRSG